MKIYRTYQNQGHQNQSHQNKNHQNKNHSKYMIGVLVFGAVSQVAVAGGGAEHSKFMEYFDSNHDNMVTLSELNDASKQRFAKMDANSDGVVTLEEFQAYVGERKNEWREQRFAAMDGNGDGQISKDEYVLYKQQKAEQRYQDMDANHDGMVSKEEFFMNRPGHRGAKHSHRHGGDRFFSRLDSNNDAQLTLDESIAAWTDWFKRIDANNDQVVTEDEVQAFRNSMRNK